MQLMNDKPLVYDDDRLNSRPHNDSREQLKEPS